MYKYTKFVFQSYTIIVCDWNTIVYLYIKSLAMNILKEIKDKIHLLHVFPHWLIFVKQDLCNQRTWLQNINSSTLLAFGAFSFYFQTSQSPFISMLTVALQLCGIPIQFTHKINFALTAILAALKDFVAFLFSVIIFHHIVDYLINSGQIKQVYDV